MNISVVVPVYNSAGTLQKLVKALHPVLDELAYEYELILVNDGSRDNSRAVMKQLTNMYSWIRAINLTRNFGQHNALLCGLRAARYGITVTIDDDLQNPPEEIKHLLAKLHEGFDVVYGSPKSDKHSLMRNFASQITKRLLQDAMGAKSASKISAFRLFRTTLRDGFADFKSPFVNLDVLLSWTTTRFSYVVIRHEERQTGQSTYTLRKLVRHALNMITGFTTVPLRLATINGFLCILFGIALLTYVIASYFIEGGCVKGFPFLVSVITMFAGAQLFSLGIIGEYMSRMYLRTIGQPPYVVNEQEEEQVVEAALR